MLAVARRRTVVTGCPLPRTREGTARIVREHSQRDRQICHSGHAGMDHLLASPVGEKVRQAPRQQ